VPTQDSINGMPLTGRPNAALAANPSKVDREVMELYERFREPLLRYEVSMGIPVHDAEEVIQEVFLSLFRHLQIGRSRANLAAWLFRVTHDLGFRQLYVNRRSDAKTTSDRTIAKEQLDPSPNAEEELSLAQRRHRLLAVFHALPEADQCCLSAGRGSSLSGGCGGARNALGSCVDIADAIIGAFDSCGRGIKLWPTKVFICRTKKCFWRRTANSQLDVQLE